MSKLLRAVLMWVVALVIPLQGIAGVSMPLCGPDQQAPASHRADGHGEHADKHATSAMHSHHHSGSGTDGFLPVDTAEDGSAHSGHDPLNCCSHACSMPGAIVASQTSAVSASSAAPLILALQLFAGVVLDNLERPPRRLLA